jgi:signal peptidase II
MSKLKKSLLIICIILVIDQALKILIKTNMVLGQEYRIFNWFIIHFVENNGMAFGMELSGSYGKIFLSVFRILVVVGIGWYLYKLTQKKETTNGLIICLSLIFAGAIGNIIDSAFYGLIFTESYMGVASFVSPGQGYASFLQGKVVDMFYFPIIQGNYPDWVPFGLSGKSFIFFRPVFNIADSAITTGIISLLVFQKKFFKESGREKP